MLHIEGIKTSIPFHRKVMRHPVFLEGRYDTGFIDEHMDGGRGGEIAEGDDEKEAHRVAFMVAAIAAYRRDKQRASRAMPAGEGRSGVDPWKAHGRWARLRGDLR